LHIFNQEENTIDSEDIGVDEREEEDRSREIVKKKVKSAILYPKE
jgi:hypothetical protein